MWVSSSLFGIDGEKCVVTHIFQFCKEGLTKPLRQALGETLIPERRASRDSNKSKNKWRFLGAHSGADNTGFSAVLARNSAL